MRAEGARHTLYVKGKSYSLWDAVGYTMYYFGWIQGLLFIALQTHIVCLSQRIFFPVCLQIIDSITLIRLNSRTRERLPSPSHPLCGHLLRHHFPGFDEPLNTIINGVRTSPVLPPDVVVVVVVIFLCRRLIVCGGAGKTAGGACVRLALCSQALCRRPSFASPGIMM